MKIYLMQHGIANPKEIDIEEGLSEKGASIIKTSAKALNRMKVQFEAILCSPKKRSRETAQIVAEEFNFPLNKIIETEKIKAMMPAEESLEVILNYESVFIAGHLPSLQEIASYLLYPTSKVLIDFINGGCSRID